MKDDQASHISPQSVLLTYRLALAMLSTIDQDECGAYR